MLKKLLSLAAFAALTLTASANVNILGSFGSSGWNSSYDADTKTITYEGAWTGRGWWLDGTDYSDYESIVIKFAEPLAEYAQIVCEYGTGENGTAGASAGATEVEYTFDNDLKSNVKQIYLQNSVAGTIVLAEAYLTELSGSNEKVLFEGEEALSWWPAYQIDKSKIIAAGAGSKLVVDVELPAGADGWSVKLGISWTGDVIPSFKELDGYQSQYMSIYTSQNPWTYTFTAADIDAIQSDGDTLRLCADETTILKKLTIITPSDESTGVKAIETVEDVNAPVEYFNLQGVRVANPQNGLFIARQGNKTSKVIIK